MGYVVLIPFSDGKHWLGIIASGNQFKAKQLRDAYVCPTLDEARFLAHPFSGVEIMSLEDALFREVE